MKQNLKKIIAGHLFEKDKPSREVCPYVSLCNRNCNEDKDCATKRFYDRYPNYIACGVGSKL
jgi:hypothetical protein